MDDKIIATFCLCDVERKNKRTFAPYHRPGTPCGHLAGDSRALDRPTWKESCSAALRHAADETMPRADTCCERTTA